MRAALLYYEKRCARRCRLGPLSSSRITHPFASLQAGKLSRSIALPLPIRPTSLGSDGIFCGPAFAGSLLFRSASGTFSSAPASPKKKYLPLCSILLRGLLSGGQRYARPARHGRSRSLPEIDPPFPAARTSLSGGGSISSSPLPRSRSLQARFSVPPGAVSGNSFCLSCVAAE